MIIVFYIIKDVKMISEIEVVVGWEWEFGYSKLVLYVFIVDLVFVWMVLLSW